MNFTVFKVVFLGAFLCEVLSANNLADNETTSLLKKCPRTQCLTDAIACLSGGKGSSSGSSGDGSRIKVLEEEVAKLKAVLDKAGKPSGFALLDSNGRLPQNFLVAGYDKYSLYDLAWQSLHMAAAAACRGSTSSESGRHANVVRVRNAADKKTCAQLCAQTKYNCVAEVSIHGKTGKATQNGEIVGMFYNYKCDHANYGGSEVSRLVTDITRFPDPYPYYSFCCCRI
ncbi:hypothetical protein ACROYT_G018892 [Oculina patagonica]